MRPHGSQKLHSPGQQHTTSSTSHNSVQPESSQLSHHAAPPQAVSERKKERKGKKTAFLDVPQLQQPQRTAVLLQAMMALVYSHAT
jgi:hypothetical protein